ncbi:MAG: di-heme oxidoredictase family protein [Cyanobacteria bacterium J06628_4]
MSTTLGAQAISTPTAPLSGGETTTFNRTSSAYEEAAPNLTPQGEADHDAGDEAFEEAFVATPGHRNSGLGPTFNNVSCESCHIRNGRGMPEPGQLLLRVSATDGVHYPHAQISWVGQSDPRFCDLRAEC